MAQIYNMAMRVSVILLYIGVYSSEASFLPGPDYPPPNERDLDDFFLSYIKEYAKNYSSKSEHEMRKAVFYENWKMIEQHNRQELSYKKKLNKFADLTSEEVGDVSGALPLERVVNGYYDKDPFPYNKQEIKELAANLPRNFDMRKEGYILDVEGGRTWDGAYYAGAGAIESTIMRKTGERDLALSKQALSDCIRGRSVSMSDIFQFIKENGGLPTEEEYTNQIEKRTCRMKSMKKKDNIKGYVRMPVNNIDAMKVTLYHHGPLAVMLNYSEGMLRFGSGVFYDRKCSSSTAYIGLLLVGYGVLDGINYWIMRGPGENWGEGGYFLINADKDTCEVALGAYYPIV